jgi:hypothetical protein
MRTRIMPPRIFTFMRRRVPIIWPRINPVIEKTKHVKAIITTANHKTSGCGIKITPVAKVSMDVANAKDNNPQKEKSAT